METYELIVETEQVIELAVEDEGVVNLDVGSIIVEVAPDPYMGEYEFTPTSETQVVPISGKTALSDITINPIPENYGLITWDGSIITVS